MINRLQSTIDLEVLGIKRIVDTNTFYNHNPSEVKNLLGDSFRVLGNGSEGTVVFSEVFPNVVTKLFFEKKEEVYIELYSNLNDTIHIPRTYHVTEGYKIMENILSIPLSDLSQDSVMKEFVYPNVFEGNGSLTKFNHPHYEDKMKSLIDFIVETAERGVYLNDLSVDNIHYDSIGQRFLILDCDMLSNEALEFPRFLEERLLTVYRDYFLYKISVSKVNISECINIFDRTLPNGYSDIQTDGKCDIDGESTEEKLNWFYYLTNPLPDKSRNNLIDLYHYII